MAEKDSWGGSLKTAQESAPSTDHLLPRSKWTPRATPRRHT